MYNVGFGDCFLLTFHYAGDERHMLVDFGSTAAPRNGATDYMRRVADDIVRQSRGKLHVLVATHRHRDHINGFTTEGEGTGKLIASLNPDHVVLPWTEDPNAAPDALEAHSTLYSRGKADSRQMTAGFLASLEDMHRVAGAIANLAEDDSLASRETRAQLQFLGEDNLKNLSAVKNLMTMGAKTHYVNAGMRLDGLLPGVKITVLGPPNLRQSDSIRRQRERDPGEFWQFAGFWAGRRRAIQAAAVARRRDVELPPNVRWFVRQSQRIQADQLLELVRDLDGVLNNTSVILLLEAGGRKLLLPGDAQIENWAFALQNREWRALLADVNLYKVGHHGSLNATPKSLWALFTNKGQETRAGRLQSLCSTRSGKHGSVKSGTEVPRRVLMEELGRNSSLVSTEDYGGELAKTVEILID
jgi:hypothetical protein